MNIYFNGNILVNRYFLGIIPRPDSGKQGTVQSNSYAISGGNNIQVNAENEACAIALPITGSTYPVLIHHSKGTWKNLIHFCANFSITSCESASE